MFCQLHLALLFIKLYCFTAKPRFVLFSNMCAGSLRCPVSPESSIKHQTTDGMRRTGSTEFDFPSLMFDDPDFNYLQSRQMFLAVKDDCREHLAGVNLHAVHMSLEGKQAMLEQRFKVKQLKRALHSASKMDEKYFKEQYRLTREKDMKHVPVVELHMFPSDPRNATSIWKVLVVPRAREVFGRRLFLCKAADQCVADLNFEALPRRLQTWLGQWDSNLDMRRSTPTEVILFTEMAVIAGLIVLLGSLCGVGLLWWHKRRQQAPEIKAAVMAERLSKEDLRKAGTDFSVVATTCSHTNRCFVLYVSSEGVQVLTVQVSRRLALRFL